MKKIEADLKEADDDNRRAQMGMAYGKLADQQYAHDLLLDAVDRHGKLIEEKKQLQDKIDALQLSLTR